VSKAEGDATMLGNNLRRLRFEKNEMTQQELADAAGVSRMTIYSIEKGKYIPSTLLALKLAEVFGKTVEELFYIENQENDGR
jgi:putative transcriptional regulator